MPVTQFSTPDPYTYSNGFNSYHEYLISIYSTFSNQNLTNIYQIRSRKRRSTTRPKFPPETTIRPLRRKALGDSLHRTPPRKQAIMALPHPPLSITFQLPARRGRHIPYVPHQWQEQRTKQTALYPQSTALEPV